MPFKDLPEGQTQYLDDNGKIVGEVSPFDPFFQTGFSYKYIYESIGVGEINVITSGHIRNVIITYEEIRAIFKHTLSDPYIIRVDGEGFFGVNKVDQNGFSVISLEKDKPIKICKNVCATIIRPSSDFPDHYYCDSCLQKTNHPLGYIGSKNLSVGDIKVLCKECSISKRIISVFREDVCEDD